MAKVRIQKIIAESGYCSRRKAEELISKGRVKLNGRPIKLGDKAEYKDIITIDGERINTPKNKKYLYLMMNKPRGYVTTVFDELGRKCVMDLLDGVEKEYIQLELDRNSEGFCLPMMVILQTVLFPSKRISKSYRVTVRPDISDEQLVKLSEGVEIDGRMTMPATVNAYATRQGSFAYYHKREEMSNQKDIVRQLDLRLRG